MDLSLYPASQPTLLIPPITTLLYYPVFRKSEGFSRGLMNLTGLQAKPLAFASGLVQNWSWESLFVSVIMTAKSIMGLVKTRNSQSFGEQLGNCIHYFLCLSLIRRMVGIAPQEGQLHYLQIGFESPWLGVASQSFLLVNLD
ncbi:hypothetical protein VNO78_24394 [Psophocarpus tetragonolobus]|uniref:Uncharacterized protein n=1 Tax=Psophocarpus tetragonolobus TaxID=3891 RepID=A0AAN9S855_PSOTE